MSLQTKIWTEAELMALPKDGNKYELVYGEIEMSPAGFFGHGDIIAWLSAKLALWARKKKLGVVFDGQSGVWMKSGNLRVPDIAFLGKDRIKALKERPQGFLHGAPDLAVEVLSPDESAKKVLEKLTDYFQSGARLVWIVNPKNKTVQIYRSAKLDRTLGSGDELNGEDVVPGFTMPVDELFEQPDFD